MRYHLRFAFKIQKAGETSLAYTPESFAEEPIPISVPEVVEIITQFLSGFEQVALVESKVETTKQKQSIGTVDANNLTTTATVSRPDSLNIVSGTIYICQQKKLLPDSLDLLCSQLSEYLHTATSDLTAENLLSGKFNVTFAGLREAIELRNYLSRFVVSRKKQYQDGYLYIWVM